MLIFPRLVADFLKNRSGILPNRSAISILPRHSFFFYEAFSIICLQLRPSEPYTRCVHGAWISSVERRDLVHLRREDFNLEDRPSIGKTLQNVRLYCMWVSTNSKCEVGTAINYFIFIIKVYLVNWWLLGYLKASRFILRKHWNT